MINQLSKFYARLMISYQTRFKKLPVFQFSDRKTQASPDISIAISTGTTPLAFVVTFNGQGRPWG